MSNNRSRAVHSKRRSDEALNVADFKIDDILNVPGDQLLAEVAEDFGDPAFLAAEFDSIARPALSSHNSSGVNRGGAIATIPMQPAAFGAAPVRAFPRHPRVSRAVLAILTEWLVVPLRRRIFLGTFATVMIVAALAPGIVSQDDPLTRSPAPTLSRPLPTGNPAPVGEPADQSPVVQNRLHALRQPSWADQKHLRTATDGDQDGGLVPDRQMSPPPSAPVPARALAPQSAAATPATPPAAARAPVQAPAAATPRVAEGGGFFVQLSALKSQAEAQSTFLTLRLKYTVLKGHEPVIRRKDEGQRGTIYALQVGPFKSPDDADELCKQLRTAGGICFVTRN